MLKNSCSALLYADIKSSVNKKTNRVDGGDRAYLFTEPPASYDATRARGLDLPDEILFDYKTFKGHIEKNKPKDTGKKYTKTIDKPKQESSFEKEMNKLKLAIGDENFNSVLTANNFFDVHAITERADQVKIYGEMMKLAA
jgi:hypothetical protein